MPSSGIDVRLDELIALRLRAAELASGVRRRAHEPRGGSLHSPFRGRGMEYAESRPYSAGDDVRHVDWRVTARSGQLHSKLFHAERERVSALIYDASPRMAFGTRVCFKSVQAARIAALYSWFALSQGDRLAGLAIGRAAADMPVTGGRKGVLQLLQHIVQWQPALTHSTPAAPRHATDLAAGVQRLQRVLRPGSHVLLLIDPHQVDERARNRLAGLSAHHDVIACVLVDPLECERLPVGRYPICQGDQRSLIEVPDTASADRWLAHFRQLHGEALAQLRRAGVRAHRVRTDDDPLLALRDLLRGVVQKELAA